MVNHNSKHNLKNKKKSFKKSSKKEKKKSIKKNKDSKKNNNELNDRNSKNDQDSKNNKVYTLDDVKKHNKKTDAWLVINNKVYNVTSWINNHPGGLIIMKGVGKDASTLYKKFRHSKNADNILKKFYIGELKN